MLYKDIVFGPDDAKGDGKLAEYFVKIPEYEKVRTGDVSYVIGRKGTGKTAICQMIYEEALNTPNEFAVLLSFKNCPSADLYASNDKNFRAPNEYISIWKFLIALESAKLLIEDESINSEIRDYLRGFIYSNFGNIDVACLDIVSTLKEKDWKVGINLPDVCGYKLPSGEITGAKKDSGHQKIHYGRAASTLISKIKEIRTKNIFSILFDELDEDYQVDKQYFHLLISLFKAAYQFKQEISGLGPDIRPIVVLREDIFGQLDDHDLNKLDDSTVRLNWQRHTSTHNDISLRGLINERIRANFGAQTISDFWTTIVDEESWGGPTDSAWDFILNRTMDRPRDLIKFLKIAQNYEKREKLSPYAVRLAIDDYSRWFYNEIGNEIFRFLPDYREALGLLTRIGKGLFTIDAWRREFGKERKLKDKYNPDAVLRVLYDFSIIGMIKGKRWLFRYKMPQITFDIGARYCVHFGIQKHLVILGKLPYAKNKGRT